MKRIIAVLLTLLVTLPVANDVLAQDEDWLRIPYHVTISADLGVGMPLRPEAFNDLWNAAFPVTIAIGYVVIPRIEIKGWFTYASWGISGIPAKNAIGVTGVTQIEGGGIVTTMYGASAKIIPLPNSRIMPYLEVGGGYFTASGDDLEVSEDNVVIVTNSMEDDSGPVFAIAGGMEYGVNERWNVYTEFNYYVGFSDTFSPASLVQRPNSNDPPDAGSMHIASIVLGLALKL